MTPNEEKFPLNGETEASAEAQAQTAAEVGQENTAPAEEAAPAEDVAPAEEAAPETAAAEQPAEENEADYFAEHEPSKRKKRVRRKDMTPEQRRRRRITDSIITASVFGVVLLFFAICALCSFVGYSGNFEYIASVTAVDYDSPYELGYDEDLGYYSFTATDDSDFRVLQLTDIHIGAGAFSAQKDSWALDAVATIVQRVKPDLVIVTGDIAYPVPFQAGTFNNMREAEMFAELMEQLGVYWTLAFGNHDTEIYSLYERDEIGAFYEDEKWTHCLFRRGPENIAGYGNDIILIKDKEGKITQALVTIDSHSYTDGDYFGIAWKYDNIHQDQIDWYAAQMDRLTQANVSNGFTENADVKNLVFFHIPLTEYGKYWNEYKDNNHQNTDTVTYVYGQAGESGEKSYPGVDDCQLFETMLEHNGQGTFCGHDHYNTFALDITTEDGKKIRLTYGMSIDYLAYVGIANKTEQRGGTEIKISQDGSFAARQRPLVGDTAEGGEWE